MVIFNTSSIKFLMNIFQVSDIISVLLKYIDIFDDIHCFLTMNKCCYDVTVRSTLYII